MVLGDAVDVDDAQRRSLGVAPGRLAPRTAGVEAASGGWVGRRGQVARQQDPLPLVLDDRIGHRHGRQQRTGVQVQRPRVEVVGGGLLGERPEYITPTRSLMCRTTARSWATTR